MTDLLTKLSGKKTHLFSLGIQILGAMFLLDTLLHDDTATAVVETTWLTWEQYAAIGAVLGGGSIQALRAAVGKVGGA